MSLRLRTSVLAIALSLLGFLLLGFMPLPAGAAPAPPPLVFAPKASVGTNSPSAGTLIYAPRPAVLPAGAVASAPTIYGQPFTNRFSDASPTGPHLVGAHLLASAGDYGKHYYGQCPSVADYVLDINEARAAGVDIFFYNIGGFDIPYKEGWANLLIAADQVNASNGWVGLGIGATNAAGVGKFFIAAQPDFSGFPQDTATIVALLAEGVSHPCYYRYKGKYWFGTYTGEGGTYAQVKARFQPVLTQMAASGTPVYFCPFFNIRDAGGGGPSFSQPVSNANEISGLLGGGFAQAAWLFSTGFGPPLAGNSGLTQAELYSSQLRAAGLQWMGSVTEQYTGMGHAAPNHFYIEASGGETLDAQWRSLILSQMAYWVQIVTWNDDDEGSNFTNADFGPTGPWSMLIHSSIPGYYKSKLGLQALNLYYIQWYKTGAEPVIAQDAVFAFYRTQPAAMVSSDPLGPVGPLTTENGLGIVTDTFYVCTMATKTSTLTVNNGSFVKSVTVPPGLFFSRLTGFVPGPVSFTLSQNGATVVTLAGEPIVSSAPAYDWNYYTAYAHD